MLNGLFFDPPPPTPADAQPTPTATFLKTDTTTQGNWIGTYGTQGYNVVDATPSYPSYATVTVSGDSTYVWSADTTDVRGLENPAAPAVASPPPGTRPPASR